MRTQTVVEKAKRLHTHTVVFQNPVEVDCAVRAMLGQTTNAIAQATGLSPFQVMYRIHKAGIRRADYRNCTSETAQVCYNVMNTALDKEVRAEITPKFVKYAHR
jgi:hypothetical protein